MSQLNFNYIVTFLKTAVHALVLTLLWIPIYLTRSFIIQIVRKFLPTYGKVLNHLDAITEEDIYTQNETPQTTIVFSLVLSGRVDLSHLKELFTRNVLEVKTSNKKTGQDELRYPELKQYQTDLCGYTFWRDDPTFHIDNHIFQKSYDNSKSYSRIHQEFQNKCYTKERSPWELVLIPNYENVEDKTLLIFRAHHTVGDAKSLLKLIVECLGAKELKLPPTKYHRSTETLLDTIIYYSLLPLYFVYVQVHGYYATLKCESNPWKWKSESSPPLNAAVSRKISLADVKFIAKKHKTISSAVIMAAVAGGVAKCDGRQARSGMPCRWLLPKADHPDKLANHSYSDLMELPTDINAPLRRLKKCTNLFVRMKSSKLPFYSKSVTFQYGTWFNPIRSALMRNRTTPLLITNVASDNEGFQVGKYPCSHFTMTSGPLQGAFGVLICIFGYKNGIEVTATSKKGIMNERQTQNLVDFIADEITILKSL